MSRPSKKFTPADERQHAIGQNTDDTWNVATAEEMAARAAAKAEQRQREREEREAAEARKAQEAERAAYYAKHGWPT